MIYICMALLAIWINRQMEGFILLRCYTNNLSIDMSRTVIKLDISWIIIIRGRFSRMVQEFYFLLTLNRARRLSVTAQDVGVTGIEDGHGGAAEELTASGTELDL